MFAKLTLLICFVLFLCNSFAAEPTIKIGMLGLPNNSSWRGAELAVNQLNATGGILGRSLQLVNYSSDQNIHKLSGEIESDKQLNFIVDPNDNNASKTVILPILKAGNIVISAGEIEDDLLTKYSNHLFLMGFTNNVQTGAIAQFTVNQMHRKKVEIIFQKNSSYDKQLVKYFKVAYKNLSGIVLNSNATTGDKLSAIMLKALSHSQANVIFLAVVPKAVPTLIKQIRKAGIKIPIVGGDSYRYVTTKIVRLGKQIADSIYFSTQGYYDKNFMDDNMLAFVKAYQRQYSKKPDSISAALGYDAVKLLAAGIEKAHSVELDKVANAIKNMTAFPSVIGTLNFTARSPSKLVTIVKIVNARPTIAALIIPQYVPKPISVK